jgi:curli biogenesis system outer membrane secretion channel CsgG
MKFRKVAFVSIFLSSLILFASVAFAEQDPVIDSSRTTKKLHSLKRQAGPKKIVTIYEFRSSCPEVNAAGATDMFTTALIKSGAFAVAERHRLNEGVMREKQLQASGMATGRAGSTKLAGAQYIFEGTVSEANSAESTAEGGFTVGGMEVGGASKTDSIGLDVRIVDAETGLVLDSVNVRKNVESGSKGISGIGKLAQSIAALKGKSIKLDPDAQGKLTRKEGVDKALRACIEVAVYEIVKRYGED